MSGELTVWQKKQLWLERVMATRDLSTGAKLLAWEIANRAYGSRIKSTPGRDVIASDLGLLSTGRLDEHRKELVRLGVVTTEIKYKGQKPYTEYTISLNYGSGTIVPHKQKDRAPSCPIPSTIVPDTEHHRAPYRAPSCPEDTDGFIKETQRDASADVPLRGKTPKQQDLSPRHLELVRLSQLSNLAGRHLSRGDMLGFWNESPEWAVNWEFEDWLYSDHAETAVLPKSKLRAV